MTTYPGATKPSKLFANLYEPIWNNDGSVNQNNYYAYYLYQLLAIYGDKVRFWEVVNEPDFTSNPATPDQWLTRAPLPGEMNNMQAPIFHYIRMLRISYEVVKKYRPEAYVTTGGIGYPQFLDALLRYTDNPNGGAVTAQYPNTAGAYLDALSFHSYPSFSLHYWDNAISGFRYNRTSDYAANQMIKDKQNMEEVLIRYGYDGVTHPAKDLLMTETNVARRTCENRTGNDEMQRNFGIKALVLAQKNNIKQLYFYCLGEWVNAPVASQSVPRADETGLMGLYENLKRDAPGSQKVTQLGQGFATASGLLYGFDYDAARTASMALPSGVDGAAFSKNGVRTYVLWAKALTDNSENASATYSFPASWNITSLQRCTWNYSVTGSKTTLSAQNIALTGAPSFFIENAASPTTGCTGTGSLLREQWDNITGNTVAAVPTSTTPSSSATISKFESPAQTAHNYAARLRGYVCPPQTGAYTFWIVADDAAELFLSTDSNPTKKVRIATSLGWVASDRDFSRSPAQQSNPIQLQAGQRYYIEALHKQGWGAGFLAVAWRLPNGTVQEPVPGSALIPFDPSTGAKKSAVVSGSTGSKLANGVAQRSEITVYPNPVDTRNGQATVQFTLTKSGPVTLSLHNTKGQVVRRLFAGTAEAGVPQTVSLEAAGLNDGVNVVRLITPTEVINQKIIYTRD